MARVLLWDLGSPYHYIRIAKSASESEEVLLVGGEDYKTGQGHAGDPADRYARLEAWTRVRFPRAGRVVHQWSGQVMEPVDDVAFIGRNPTHPTHSYVVTGDSGQGMTHGTIAGLLISDLIAGRSNAWEGLYDPSRKTLRAAPEYARENLNVAAQLLDYATRGEVRSEDDIPPDSGAIVRRGLTKHAIYRDSAGELHEMPAACPHLGCIVAWNSGERTWDCPCHGSRFDAIGKVICGPANTDLTRLGKEQHT